MKIGDLIQTVPVFMVPAARPNHTPVKPKPIWGKVVYIHPEGRFYTAEFDFPAGTIRESIWPEDIIRIQCR